MLGPPKLDRRVALSEVAPMKQAYFIIFLALVLEATFAAAGAFASIIAVKMCVLFLQSPNTLLGTLSESSTDLRYSDSLMPTVDVAE